MSSVNKVILVGNLGRDPEARSTSTGTRIVSLSVATSESWKDKQSGERKERTEWHRVVIFNERLAEVAEKYLNRGSKVYIEGQLQTRKWEQDGVDRYTTEVVLQQFRGELVMLGDNRGEGGARRGGSEADPDHQPRGRGRSGMDASTARNSQTNDLDDDIPFLTCDPAYEPYLKRRIVA